MSQQDVVTWLDPGRLTGLAWWDPKTNLFSSWQYESEDLAKRLHFLTDTYGDRLVVGYESYLVAGSARSGTPKHSLKAIGVIEDLAEQGLYRLAPPVPSSSRKLGSVAWLRRMGWYKPGKPHANDAAMHLLAYQLKQKPMPPYIKGKLFPGYAAGATITT